MSTIGKKRERKRKRRAKVLDENGNTCWAQREMQRRIKARKRSR